MVCTSGLFVLPVGLCEWKITTVQSILRIMFENILRAREAGTLKTFKNIQPQSKNETFLEKTAQ